MQWSVWWFLLFNTIIYYVRFSCYIYHWKIKSSNLTLFPATIVPHLSNTKNISISPTFPIPTEPIRPWKSKEGWRRSQEWASLSYFSLKTYISLAQQWISHWHRIPSHFRSLGPLNPASVRLTSRKFYGSITLNVPKRRMRVFFNINKRCYCNWFECQRQILINTTCKRKKDHWRRAIVIYISSKKIDKYFFFY